MTSKLSSPQRLTRLAYWALSLDQRQRFAGMVARRNETMQRLADLYGQAESLAEAMVSRSMPSAARHHARISGWTPAHEDAFQSAFATMLVFRSRELTALLARAQSHDANLQDFAESNRFRSVEELATGLGLSLAATPPSSANEP